MWLLADENFPLPTIEALRQASHDVTWARTDCPRTKDGAGNSVVATPGPCAVAEIKVRLMHPLETYLQELRRKDLLGRSLSVEEARYVTDMARRIAAILLLTPALDANYRAVKQEP